MTHLNFERFGIKTNVQEREKKERKKNLHHC
jgi:hypothetical protein